MENGKIWSGRRGHFHWLVAWSSLPSIAELTVRAHPGLRLCITSFDSGPIRPTPEDEAGGWTSRGEVMVSPPLAEGIEIPSDQFDEWYLLEEPPPSGWQPEVFVNYITWTVVPAETLGEGGNPYGDLSELQSRFWEQMERVNPVSYVAMGNLDIVVSRRLDFIERLKAEVGEVGGTLTSPARAQPVVGK